MANHGVYPAAIIIDNIESVSISIVICYNDYIFAPCPKHRGASSVKRLHSGIPEERRGIGKCSPLI